MDWRLCKNELPEKNEYVIITVKDKDNNVYTLFGFINEGDDQWYRYSIEEGDEVIAWMPLPEPYPTEKIEQKRMANEYSLQMARDGMIEYDDYISYQIIAGLVDNGFIINRATFYSYSLYTKLCKDYNVKPMSNIAFSKFVTRNFNFNVEDKKFNNKKYRVFRDAK